MSKIRIMTDSASDISYADEQKYAISVIPFPITLGGKTYTSRVDFDNEQFFSLMAQYDEIPKTAQITPFQFQEIYLREAQAGVTDLILVLINSKGSSTYDNSVQAIELFYEEYPEYRDVLHIHSFDGMGYNALYGSPVVHAAQMCADGAPLEAILQYLTDVLPWRLRQPRANGSSHRKGVGTPRHRLRKRTGKRCASFRRRGSVYRIHRRKRLGDPVRRRLHYRHSGG